MKNRAITLRVCRGLIVLMLVPLFLGALLLWSQNSRLKSWPVISAKVQYVAIAENKKRKGTAYCTDLFVVYTYKGATFQNSVKGHDCSLMRYTEREAAKKYPIGSEVNIILNPQKPTETRQPNISSWPIYLVTFSILLIFFVIRLLGKNIKHAEQMA